MTPPPARKPPPKQARDRRAARPYRPPADDKPRRAAYDVLVAVREKDAYANLVLPGLLRERGITGRDAALATELAYGALRGQGLYDAVVQACVDRRSPRSTRRCSTSCAWAPTSSCAPASRSTPRSRPPSTWPAVSSAPGRSPS
jgi:hypothetical protein